ncbi:MAG TPA: flagellar motor protein [Acidimicrobiia bacterium]|nr:flagellar motor protein [Acidimicrobiia bacterium]
MDPLTLVGVVGGILLVLVGGIMEGAQPGALIGIPAFMIVVIPSFLVALAGYTKADISSIVGGLKQAFTGKVESAAGSIELVVEFAERARKEGLLALEEGAKTIEDPFLKKGIMLAVDGTDPEELREILEAEVASKKAHSKVPAKFFADMGGFSPTLGIVGAVMGLMHVLGNLSDPASAGEGIAGAFVATFYGVLFANAIYLPLSNKLKRIAEAEAQHMELVLEGILSIQAGSNPRVIEQKLLSFLPDKEREALEAERAA